MKDSTSSWFWKYQPWVQIPFHWLFKQNMKANKGSKISFQKTCTRTNECSNIVCNEPKTNQNHLCIIVFSTHSRVRMKAIFQKKKFNIAVSCKRNPHTTPSNDLVANTYMHVFKLYTESMQQWVDILDLQVQSCCMQTVGSYLPLDPSGWFRAAAECLG